MGRTPVKWLKTLLGKKSPKPKLSKDKDILNSAYRGDKEALISSKAPPTILTATPPNILPVAEANVVNDVDLEKVVSGKGPNAGIVSSIEDADGCTLLETHSLDESAKARLQEAATKVQGAFRGYLARRAFRTLKGIVRLQAFIRGHLVRRQAVATLCCMQSIVKFQAIVRSRKDPKWSKSLRRREGKLLKSAFIQKLLAPCPSAMPLHIQYPPGDPNSASEWLERWTRSCFWEHPPQPKKKSQAKHQRAEVDQGRTKRSVRKLPSSNGEMGSGRSSSQSDKVNKRHSGKVSGNTGHLVQEISQNDNEKPKGNLKKARDLAKVVSDPVEVDDEKSKNSPAKAPGASACDELVEGISNLAELVNGTEEDSVATINQEKSLNSGASHDPADELHELSLNGLGNTESNGNAEEELNCKDDGMSNENQQITNRRVSLPAKMENGARSMPRLPSYMASTESAKAKLRAQDSPRFVPDDVEKNGYTRRHSLPSSTNGKVTSFSPRAHRLVEASGKGAIKNEGSLMSSRDCVDKVTKAEWRR